MGPLLAVRFLTELALLGALAWAGADVDGPTPVRILLAVLLPAGAVAVWGAVVAPKARRRLPDPARLAVEVVLFVAAGSALAAVGHPLPAAGFVVVAVATAALVRAFARGA